MRTVVVLALILATVPVAEARPLDEAGAGDKPAWWDWTTIVPGKVGLGGGDLTEEEVAYIAEQGFGAVLSLREEREDPANALAAHGLAHLRVPLGDAEHDTLSVDEMQQAIDFIDAQLADGRAVYVHCIAGWHRSAAVVTGWLMARDGTDADTAWAKVEALRPTVEPRWIDAVYAYEAHRAGKPKLEVDVHVGSISPEEGAPITLTAVVTLGGEPFEAAEVHLESEYDRIEVDAVSDAEGRAELAFDFDGSKRQYVHAVARAPGLVPGYDRATMYGDGSRREPGPFTFSVAGPADPVAPGADVLVTFTATDAAGRPYNLRATVGDGDRTLWRGYLGRDGAEDATFTAERAPGEHTLVVRATTPYAETYVTELRYFVAGTEPVDQEPSQANDTADAPPREALGPAVGVGARAVPAGALAGVVLAVGAAALRRRGRD